MDKRVLWVVEVNWQNTNWVIHRLCVTRGEARAAVGRLKFAGIAARSVRYVPESKSSKGRYKVV